MPHAGRCSRRQQGQAQPARVADATAQSAVTGGWPLGSSHKKLLFMSQSCCNNNRAFQLHQSTAQGRHSQKCKAAASRPAAAARRRSEGGVPAVAHDHGPRHLPHLLLAIQCLDQGQGKLKRGAGAPVGVGGVAKSGAGSRPANTQRRCRGLQWTAHTGARASHPSRGAAASCPAPAQPPSPTTSPLLCCQADMSYPAHPHLLVTSLPSTTTRWGTASCARCTQRARGWRGRRCICRAPAASGVRRHCSKMVLAQRQLTRRSQCSVHTCTLPAAASCCTLPLHTWLDSLSEKAGCAVARLPAKMPAGCEEGAAELKPGSATEGGRHRCIDAGRSLQTSTCTRHAASTTGGM